MYKRNILTIILLVAFTGSVSTAVTTALADPCPSKCCRLPVNCCASASQQTHSALPADDGPCCSIQSALPPTAWTVRMLRPLVIDDDAPLRHAFIDGRPLSLRSPGNAGNLGSLHRYPHSTIPVYLKISTLLC